MRALLAVSGAIDAVLERIARLTGWLFFALVAVIVWDVITRKFSYAVISIGGTRLFQIPNLQIPDFESTPLQELEWHLHGVLFLFWLGYAYVRNVHVRIDIFTARLAPRRAAGLEIFGILAFAIPYTLVALHFSYFFAETSFLQNERSSAPNGLGYRWIIKSCLFVGLCLLMASVVSVLCRNLVVLLGPRELAARARPQPPVH
jgi:TRAP-type mannitol/chloroaromatic compound transport system permease small subunit